MRIKFLYRIRFELVFNLNGGDMMARIIKFTDNKYFNIDERMLYIGGEPVGTELKGIPFRILVYLAKNSPIFLNQDQIIEECWNNDHCEGSVPYHIMMLRRKIQEKNIWHKKFCLYYRSRWNV